MAKLRLGLFLMIFWLLSAQTSYAQLLLDERNSYDLNGWVFSMMEIQKALTVNETIEELKAGKFTATPTPDNEFYKPLVKNVYWLAVPVKASDRDVELEAGIANSGIYHVEYYLVSLPDGKVLKKHVTGKQYSFFSRLIKNRHYYFPVALKAGEQATILFRLDKRGDGLNAPVRLVKKPFRQQTEFSAYFQYAFFFGLMMFVSLFSIVSFLWSKDYVYLYHSLYVFCCCLFFLADGDLDYEWLYPDWPAWASIASSIYAVGIVFFMMLFMSSFLQLKASHPKLFKLARICTLSIASLFILIPLGYVFGGDITMRVGIYYYGLLCVTAGWLLSIYCIFRRVVDKFKPAYLYGFAIISVVLASTFYILQSLDITIHNFIPFNYLLVGFGIEIVILSFALIYSFNYYKTNHYELSISLANEQFNSGERLLQSQQSEQQRIARDLHDELGGNLAAMKMTLQRLDQQDEKVILLNYLVDTTSKNARNIAHNLMPPEFENTTLPELLERYFLRLNTDEKTQYNFYCSGANNHFSKQQELMIYRIVLELANNITKHAAATEADLQLVYNDTHLEIIVEDDGHGFDLAKCKDGIGIKSIRARADYLNGKINIDTGFEGTTIIIQIPYIQENGNN
jgi:signal transduction histidine kinase